MKNLLNLLKRIAPWAAIGTSIALLGYIAVTPKPAHSPLRLKETIPIESYSETHLPSRKTPELNIPSDWTFCGEKITRDQRNGMLSKYNNRDFSIRWVRNAKVPGFKDVGVYILGDQIKKAFQNITQGGLYEGETNQTIQKWLNEGTIQEGNTVMLVFGKAPSGHYLLSPPGKESETQDLFYKASLN